MKKFTMFLLAMGLMVIFNSMTWAVSSSTGSINDAGFTDPRIYGGAADTVKQTTAHTAGTDTLALTITAGYLEMGSNASSTLEVTMTETGATEGDRVKIVNIGSGTITFSDQGGILNVASGSMSVGAEDTLSLMYTGTIWVETARSNN